MKKYVTGFLFDYNMQNLVLIKKNRPEWQKDKLNGVGGHIEYRELPKSAMAREFQEETGYLYDFWKPLITLKGEDWICYFFYGIIQSHQKLDNIVSTKTDETITIVPSDNLPKNIIPNLEWLIPLAKDIVFSTYKFKMIYE